MIFDRRPVAIFLSLIVASVAGCDVAVATVTAVVVGGAAPPLARSARAADLGAVQGVQASVRTRLQHPDDATITIIIIIIAANAGTLPTLARATCVGHDV